MTSAVRPSRLRVASICCSSRQRSAVSIKVTPSATACRRTVASLDRNQPPDAQDTDKPCARAAADSNRWLGCEATNAASLSLSQGFMSELEVNSRISPMPGPRTEQENAILTGSRTLSQRASMLNSKCRTHRHLLTPDRQCQQIRAGGLMAQVMHALNCSRLSHHLYAFNGRTSTSSPPSAAGPDVTVRAPLPTNSSGRALRYAGTSIRHMHPQRGVFDNPDHVEIVIHNYRRQLGLAVRDSSYEVRSTSSKPVRWSQSRQIRRWGEANVAFGAEP